MADLYPNLGYDPCPGDLPGYHALADYAGRSAATLTDAVRMLGSAGSDGWRGEAADAFRSHVHQEVLPLASKAAGSVGQAAQALREWALTLSELQSQARALDRQAAPYQAELTAAHRLSTVTGSAALTPAQQARVDEANSALSRISARAGDIHARYLSAVQKTGSQLQTAGNMAPKPPGGLIHIGHLIEHYTDDITHGATGLGHLIEHDWDDAVHGVSVFVHDKALLEFISSVANIVATAAGLLALFPPLSAICAPIALFAAGVATGMDALLAIFDGGSWVAVGLDAGSFLAGAGVSKATGKLADIFEKADATGLMTKAPTWAGVASKVPGVTKIPKVGAAIDSAAKPKSVAPGVFRMMGASLKSLEIFGGNTTDQKAFDAMKAADWDKTATWRAIDMGGSFLNWGLSGGSTVAIPGTIHNWLAEAATGKEPWNGTGSRGST